MTKHREWAYITFWQTLLLTILIALCCVMVCFAIGIAIVVAHAEPPPGPPGPNHAWFEKQHAANGAWCCNVSDGHVIGDDEWRMAGDHYEVLIYGKWYPVTNDHLVNPAGGPNPTGHAIVWYTYHQWGPTIYCFTPGNEL